MPSPLGLELKPGGGWGGRCRHEGPPLALAGRCTQGRRGQRAPPGQADQGFALQGLSGAASPKPAGWWAGSGSLGQVPWHVAGTGSWASPAEKAPLKAPQDLQERWGRQCVRGGVSSLKPGSFLLSPESGWVLTWGTGSGASGGGDVSRRAEASPFQAVPSSNSRDLQRCLNYWPCHKSAAETR